MILAERRTCHVQVRCSREDVGFQFGTWYVVRGTSMDRRTGSRWQVFRVFKNLIIVRVLLAFLLQHGTWYVVRGTLMDRRSVSP